MTISSPTSCAARRSPRTRRRAWWPRSSAYYGEAVPDYVRRRHGELKRRGLTNDRIFDEIAAELAARRFAARRCPLRQLRRLVYG